LPHYRIGGKILIRRTDFDDWASGFRAVAPDRVSALVTEALEDCCKMRLDQMGVKVRFHKRAWWVFVDHRGRRRAKKIGDRETACEWHARSANV
jgi:hypothetical protein